MTEQAWILVGLPNTPREEWTWEPVPRQNVNGGYNQVWPAYDRFVPEGEIMFALRYDDPYPPEPCAPEGGLPAQEPRPEN